MRSIRSSRPPLAAAAIVALLAVTQPAHAAVMEAIYSGVITSDAFGTGADMFGLEQANLVGSAFQMTFRYDTTRGHFEKDSFFVDLIGGPLVNLPSPVFAADVRVNGISKAIAGDLLTTVFESIVTQRHCVTVADALSLPGVEDAHQGLQACGGQSGFAMPLDLETAFHIQPDDPDLRVRATFIDEEGGEVVNSLRFVGSANDLIVRPFVEQAAVPEPGAWTLMICGLGLAGARLRSRGGVAA